MSSRFLLCHEPAPGVQGLFTLANGGSYGSIVAEAPVSQVALEYHDDLDQLILEAFTKVHGVLLNLKVQDDIPHGRTLAGAESCTGGMVAQTITAMDGSSGYFWGTMVTYSNEAKVLCLGLDPRVIEEYGAVSKETVGAMVQGVLDLTGSRMGYAITGIAGPQGGTPVKPCGTVFVATALEGACILREYRFTGDRHGVRKATTLVCAMQILELVHDNS